MASLPIGNREQAVNAILSRVSEIAVLPQVVYKIIELTGNTSTAAQEIENAIAIDPGFSSKVLMLANSAYYALPRKLTSIREAATFLGYKTIRQLAMTVGVFDMFIGKTDAGSLRRRTWWRHSVDTAVCAQTIAKAVRTMAADDAYSCGLLHDVGKPILEMYGQGDYSLVEERIKAGASALAAEIEVFGCSHEDIGGAAAESWRFPELLQEAVANHHRPPMGEVPLHCAVTCLANEMAHLVVAGRTKIDENEEAEAAPAFSAWATEALSFTPERIEQTFDACKQAIANGSARGM